MTRVDLNSNVFKSNVRRTMFSNFVYRQAKDFKVSTKEKMIEGPHSGRLYEKKSGRGFTRHHRASAPGERPSPDTMTLVNAIEDKRTSEISATVYVEDRVNPENGALASNYAERLQFQMERPIMDERDVYQATYKMLVEGEQLVAQLT